MMFCTFQCITIYTFQSVAPTTPPGTTLVSSFSENFKISQKTLRFELNTLNLSISVLHKTKYPIASGGLRPPDPLLQRSTTVISPPLSEILDPPLLIWLRRGSRDPMTPGSTPDCCISNAGILLVTNVDELFRLCM